MNDTYKKIFGGFLLVMIDINIGSFDVLPDVIGYLMVLFGLRELYSKTEEPSFGVARFFAIWMTLSAVIEILTVTFKLIYMDAFISYIVMIFGGLGSLLLVVCIYQGITDHMRMLDETALSHRFGNENKRYALIQGISLMVMSFSLNIPKDSSGAYMIGLLLISIVMHIRFLMNLNTAKNVFEIEVS